MVNLGFLAMSENRHDEVPVDNSDLPAVVSKAFAPEPTLAGPVKLHPLTMTHYLAMKRFCPEILSGVTDLQDMALMRALLIMSASAEDVKTQLLPLDVEGVDNKALDFSTTLPLASIAQLGEAIAAHMAATFDTALPTAGGKAQKKTASGGGSRRLSSAAASSAGRSTTR